MDKKMALSLLGVAVVALVIGYLVGINKTHTGSLGAAQTAPTYVSNQTAWDTGYFWGNLEVKGTAYFDGPVSGIATSSLSTLTVSGATSLAAVSASGISTMATTSVTSLCVWNGTNWTKITFSGVTPSYATSTTCL